jgi:hypothetical protein
MSSYALFVLIRVDNDLSIAVMVFCVGCFMHSIQMEQRYFLIILEFSIAPRPLIVYRLEEWRLLGCYAVRLL